jgi:hypothetical protein
MSKAKRDTAHYFEINCNNSSNKRVLNRPSEHLRFGKCYGLRSAFFE